MHQRAKSEVRAAGQTQSRARHKSSKDHQRIRIGYQ
jgi:hypothetical protein